MHYDLAIVGGGLSGAALATALSAHGARVLIVEREVKFRDRVRGEVTHPWGVAEAMALGIYKSLIDTCAHTTRWWVTPQGCRDLAATTKAGVGCMNFHHPEMQECLLALARDARVDVRQPAEVIAVTPGRMPSIVIQSGVGVEHITARLVVGADGRSSRVGSWGGFPVNKDPDCLIIAGTFHERLNLPEDTVQAFRHPTTQQNVLIIPVGRHRFRSYVMFRHDAHSPLSGRRDAAAYIEACLEAGASPDWFVGSEINGPLASFNAADTWVDNPFREGIVLVGEAAAAIDPSFGSGISLSLRDVRMLRDRLLETSDWWSAAAAYAQDHDRAYSSLHNQHNGARLLFYTPGPKADALRARALPKLASEPSRRPDVIGLGPDAPSDEVARRRFFGIE
jgi:2-polyprenyl-6-methoxyphenol hydroxylase-like FAD-dependent oxidoreductase